MDAELGSDGMRRPRSTVRQRVALAAAAGALVFVGIVTNSQAGPPSGSDPSTAPVQSPEDRYVDWMRDRVAGASGRTDSELIAGGRDLCSAMDEMDTPGELQLAATVLATDYGYNIEEMGSSLVGAVNTFCPENAHLTDG